MGKAELQWFLVGEVPPASVKPSLLEIVKFGKEIVGIEVHSQLQGAETAIDCCLYYSMLLAPPHGHPSQSGMAVLGDLQTD